MLNVLELPADMIAEHLGHRDGGTLVDAALRRHEYAALPA
jgi:hypothetical protein